MTNTRKNDRDEKVIIKDLEPLLQKSFGDERLKVTDFTATRLLPPGENYCSEIVKLDVEVIGGNSKKEKLQLVAKKASSVDEESQFINWVDVFQKEVFMFAKLLPAYRDLEIKMGMEEKRLFDILPRYVGHRNSLKINHDTADEDSLILMENIKVQGYDSENRQKGLDVNFAKVALSALARYHALGIALKEKRPDIFKIAVTHAQTLGINFAFLDKGFKNILKNFKEVSDFKKNFAIIESTFSNVLEGKTYKCEPEEPWATITHGDFWVNNIMFHKDKEGKPDDVKFVDFQIYLYKSPLKDLPYFLFGSLDDFTRDNHFDDLLTAYYESFVNTLKRMGCNTAPFSWKAFDAELKKQAIRELPLVALASKFFLFEVDQGQKETLDHDASSVFDSQCSDSYRKRLMSIVDIYEKRGWFL